MSILDTQVVEGIGYRPQDSIVLVTYPFKGGYPGAFIRFDLDVTPSQVGRMLARLTPESWRLVSYSAEPELTRAHGQVDTLAYKARRSYRHARWLTTEHEQGA